jgi:serine/threonine protein kinase
MNMSTARGAGTLRWQAPELLAANDDSNSPTPRNTFASDVYALGMVYYEASKALFRF